MEIVGMTPYGPNLRLVLIAALLVGCSRQPSATEVFNLRQRCGDAAKKYVEANIGLTPHSYSAPHYNVNDNRCYIREVMALPQSFAIHTVYDVQTREELVSITEYSGGDKKAVIEGRDASYEEAKRRVEKLMEQPY